jgi:hypothetical protein
MLEAGNNAAHVEAGPAIVAIRPERILPASDDAGAGNRVSATIVANSYLGARNLLVARIGDQLLRIELDDTPSGEKIELELPRDALSIFPATDEDA